MSNYIIAENGDFPPQYNVLAKGEDGIYRVVFGPDPDLEDAERKHKELSGTPKKRLRPKAPVTCKEKNCNQKENELRKNSVRQDSIDERTSSMESHC